MTGVTVSAPAKINLTLDVGPRRPDGYHDIRSVMQTIEMHDTLEISLTPGQPGTHLAVTGDEAEGVPTDDANIVHRAAARLYALAPDAPGLQVTLTKRIPSQAGLGGGSSDAAATLLGVNTLLGLHLPPPRLTEIAATLGADVPFFLAGGTALVEGLGERVTPLSPLRPDWPLVIVKPPIGVPTAWAYGALDALPARVPGTATGAWLRSDPEGRLANDFEPVILPHLPAINAAYALLNQTSETGGSFTPLLCGSGSALFCRAGTEEAAERLAKRAREANIGKAWVTRTQRGSE